MRKPSQHANDKLPAPRAPEAGRIGSARGFLCVVTEVGTGPTRIRRWWPIAKAARPEIRGLFGRPLIRIDSTEGIYIDEEGDTYELADKGETLPIKEKVMEAEKIENEPGDTAAQNGTAPKYNGGRKRRRRAADSSGFTAATVPGGSDSSGLTSPAPANHSAIESRPPGEMTLRQKLGEVRRRIGYIRKRGHNQLHDYSYVTAADIAGTIGDILAELGVIIIPRLESIAYEAQAPGRANPTRIARVIMTYTFADANSGDEVTVKVAGEGLDVGDKASYKAMTGALKYALLQSFLLATGDDPEEERAAAKTPLQQEHLISPAQGHELQRLLEETGTDLERVLTYYKISALSDMSQTSYRRALDILKRRLAKQTNGNGAHLAK